MILALLILAGGCPTASKSPAENAAAPAAELNPASFVAIVGEPLLLSASGSVGESFVWTVGDGQVLEGESVSFTANNTGRLSLQLTAFGADGRTDVASGTIVAVNQPLPDPPTASSRLALSEGSLYAVLHDSNALAVVEGNTVTARWETCQRPGAVSAAHGLVAVACEYDSVWVFDAEGTRMAALDFRWGARPAGVAVDPVEDEVLVALSGTNELVRMSLRGEEISRAQLADPRGIAATSETIFSARFRSADDAGAALKVNSGGETVIVIPKDIGPDSDTDARGLPTYLGAVAISPDGETVVVAGSKANVDRGLERDGQAYTFETASRATLRILDANSGEQILRSFFDNRDMVASVAFTPLGDLLLAAHQGSGEVDILDPFTLTRVGGFQEVGVGLDGIATDGTTAWVLASWDRALVAYDISNPSAELELARINLVETEPLSAEILLGAHIFHNAGDPRMSTDGYLSCASCHLAGDQDGRMWDFTDRGEGFRNSQPIWGMPADGPFHWSANFDELQDFEAAIRAHQAGDGFMSDADFAATEDSLGAPKAGFSDDLDALAAYMQSLVGDVPRSPYREQSGELTESATRGETIFATEGCASCHAGPELTDAGWNDDRSPILHDIGTILPTSGQRLGGELTGLRTPSLRGLFATAPYLHDGREATVSGALSAHGIVLDNADADDLLEYLLEIESTP